MFDLEREIRKWSDRFREKSCFLNSDVEELESHLYEEIGRLKNRPRAGIQNSGRKPVNRKSATRRSPLSFWFIFTGFTFLA